MSMPLHRSTLQMSFQIFTLTTILLLSSLACAAPTLITPSFPTAQGNLRSVEQSTCDVDVGCPHASMAWANGTFTSPRILSPAAFATDNQLTLQFSLCCGYKFHGAMLRDVALYDEFLDALLHSTPFRVLSVESKRHMFPRDRATIHNTQTGRVFDRTYTLTESDIAYEDDGDGDVLLLLTGKVGKAIYNIPFFHQEKTILGNSEPNKGSAAAKRYDVQLAISNRVLKCKCPHRLTVMPHFLFHEDRVPEANIIGAGKICGSVSQMERIKQGGDNGEEVLVRRVVFSTTDVIPELTHIEWTIRKLFPSSSISNQQSSLYVELNHASSTQVVPIQVASEAQDAFSASDKKDSNARAGSYTILKAQSISTFEAFLEPNILYQVELVLRKGHAERQVRDTFLLRLPFAPDQHHHHDAKVPVPWRRAPEIYFGIRKQLSLSRPLTEDLHRAFSPFQKYGFQIPASYEGYWKQEVQSSNSNGAASRATVMNYPCNASFSVVCEVTLRRDVNYFSYEVTDVDRICPPTMVEQVPIFAVAPWIVLPATPLSAACQEEVPLVANDGASTLQSFYQAQQDFSKERSTNAAIQAATASWSLVPEDAYRLIVRSDESLKDGDEAASSWNCHMYAPTLQPAQRVLSASTACTLDATYRLNTTLQMQSRAIATVQYGAVLAIQTRFLPHILAQEQASRNSTKDWLQSLAIVDHMTNGFAQRLSSLSEEEDSGVLWIQLNTAEHSIFRRTTSLPPNVTVTLPTRDEVLRVNLTQEVASQYPTLSEAALNVLVRGGGNWRIGAIQHLSWKDQISSHSGVVVTLDTSEVPNEVGVLSPRPALEYILKDNEGDTFGGGYVARCPDTTIEVIIAVVALPPIAVVPLIEKVYLDSSDVELRAPRQRARDERVEWSAPHCSDAPQQPKLLAPDTEGAFVDDVLPWTHCEVHWTATNLAGVVTKRFLLRRCEDPSPLQFRNVSSLEAILPLPPQKHRLPQLSTEVVIPIAGDVVDVAFSYRMQDGVARAAAMSSEWPAAAYRPLRSFQTLFQFVAEVGAVSATTKTPFSASTDDEQNEEEATFYNAFAAKQLQYGEVQLPKPEMATQWEEEHSADTEDIFGNPIVPPHYRLWFLSRNVTSSPASNATLTQQLSNNKESILSVLRFTSRIVEQGEEMKAALAKLSDEDQEDRTVFRERHMCQATVGHVSFFSLTPLGVVPPSAPVVVPLAAAIPLIPILRFCSAVLHIARHEELHTVFGYTLMWECGPLMEVEIVSAVSHLFWFREDVSTFEEICTLTIYNAFSKTESQPQQYVLKRVFPSSLDASLLETHGASAVPPAAVAAAASASATASAARRRGHAGPTSAVPFTTNKKFVGKLGLLYITPPAGYALSTSLEQQYTVVSQAYFNATAVTPSFTTKEQFVGSVAILNNVSFTPANTAPAGAVAWLSEYGPTAVPAFLTRDAQKYEDDLSLSSDQQEKGVWTVMSVHTPGIYTITLTQPDRTNPDVCPAILAQYRVQVFRAEVLTPRLVVCNNIAGLRAVPLPNELTANGTFQAQWEVVSRQIHDKEGGLRTAGIDFAGIRFESGVKPETRVSGLPFGILTIRWAIYRQYFENPEEPKRVTSRERVDEAFVTIYVLTENFASDRLITLSESASIVSTSSTVRWRFEQDLEPFGLEGAISSATNGRSVTKSLLRYGDFLNQTSEQVLRVEHLRVGVTRLVYDTQVSSRAALLQAMKGLKCPVPPPPRVFLVERVHAYLSLRTSMLDHECDAYRKNASIVLCLEAGDAASQKFFAERVTLVDPSQLERVIKSEAEALAHDGRCSVPWWVTDAANWTTVETEDEGRCLRVHFHANRHLSSAEVSHPLFTALLRSGSTAASSGPFTSSPNTRAEALFEAQLLCPLSPDIITSSIIQGASVHSDHYQASRPASVSQKFLAVLNRTSLARIIASMRPLVGLQGLREVQMHEGHVSNGTAKGIVLRLDNLNPKSLAEFIFDNRTATSITTEEDDEEHEYRPPLLEKCLQGTLTGADVLSHWREADRVDADAHGFSPPAWLNYEAFVKDLKVPCEPLFQSLAHMIPRQHDTLATLTRRRGTRVLPLDQKWVSVPELEEQLADLQRSQSWTRDGIEISGMSAELQNALNRKKISRRQFEEFLETRRSRRRSAASATGGVHYKDDEDDEVQEEEDELKRDGNALIQVHDAHQQDRHKWQSRTREELAQMITEYERWIREQATFAIRIWLPKFPSFYIRYALHLRPALHKDVICGSNIKPTSQASQSVVLLSRVHIFDDPPVLATSPLSIKQCDVEASIPPLRFDVDNAIFRAALLGDFNSTASQQQQSSSHSPSVSNPLIDHWVALAGSARPFIRLEEIVNPNISQTFYQTQKKKFAYSDDKVGLAPCIPLFLRGARFSLDRKTKKTMFLQLSPCPAFQMLSNEEYNEYQDSDAILERLQHPRLLQVTVEWPLEPDSHQDYRQTRPVKKEPLLFVVAVRPTTVRIHLLRNHQGRVQTRALSPSLLPQSLVCESELKHDGFTLALELIGDEWHPNVGRTVLAADPLTPHGHPVQRVTPHTTAMLNSFSRVEHFRLDATEYSFMASAGGSYRSQFLHHLFSSVLSDANILKSHRFVTRHNDTFVSITIPPSSAQASSQIRGALTTGHSADDDDRALLDAAPAVSPFNVMEEILFAVPGIATQCHGCLLADKTFLIGGDFSGFWTGSLWTPPSLVKSRHDGSALPFSVTQLVAPHVLSFASRASLSQQTWSYQWTCAAPTQTQQTPLSLLRRFGSIYAASNVFDHSKPNLVVELHVQQARDYKGYELPPHERPLRLLSSTPKTLAELEKQKDHLSQITFDIPMASLEESFRVLQEDVEIRLGKRHVAPIFDYVRDERYTEGRLAVNASIILKACVSAKTSAKNHQNKQRCTVVNVRHALVLLEESVSLRSRLTYASDTISTITNTFASLFSSTTRQEEHATSHEDDNATFKFSSTSSDYGVRTTSFTAYLWSLITYRSAFPLFLHHIGSAALVVVAIPEWAVGWGFTNRSRRMEFTPLGQLIVGVLLVCVFAWSYEVVELLWGSLWIAAWSLYLKELMHAPAEKFRMAMILFTVHGLLWAFGVRE